MDLFVRREVFPLPGECIYWLMKTWDGLTVQAPCSTPFEISTKQPAILKRPNEISQHFGLGWRFRINRNSAIPNPQIEADARKSGARGSFGTLERSDRQIRKGKWLDVLSE